MYLYLYLYLSRNVQSPSLVCRVRGGGGQAPKTRLNFEMGFGNHVKQYLLSLVCLVYN